MIQLFKRSDITALIALIVFALGMNIKYIIYPEIINVDNSLFNTLFFKMNFVQNIYLKHPTLYIFLSIVFHLIFSIYINFKLSAIKLLPKNNYLIALSYLFIISFFGIFILISSAWIANIFIFTAFSMVLNLNTNTKTRITCFYIGILISFAILFYFPSILFFIAFLLLILIIRPFILQEIIAYLIGFITPFYFVFSIFYLQNQLKQKIINGFLNIHLPVQIINPLPLFIFSLSIFLLFIYSHNNLVKNEKSYTTAVRKKWGLLYFFMLFSFASSFFTNQFPGNTFVIFLTTFSILLSQAFQHRNQKWNIFTFYLLLITIIGIQWFKL